jgi:hypothetical protein
MTGDHHSRTARRTTLLVTATDEILGTYTLTGRPSGPVSVALRGESAARIDQLINGLQVTKLALVCAEEAQLYQITFTVVAGAKRGLDVTGYQCGGLVVITSKGKTLSRTDRNCTLLSAVRRLLPASATATQRLDAPCAS